MTKLFEQQQLSAGVQEFEEHLHRVRARDWTVDCQLAQPRNDPPPPPRREGVRKAAAGNASGAAPAKGNEQPADLSMETLHSRRLILALAALVLVTFAGAMSLALTDGDAPTAEAEMDVGAVAADASSTVPPTSEATQAKTPAAVSAPASATSETYVATIRPDGSLAPDTTPHATVATPPATVAAPSPDPIATVITSGEQSEPAPSAPAEANAPNENPAGAKPTKKRTAAHAANLASVNPAAADGDPAATAANPAESGHPAAAAKPAAPKPGAHKARAASVAAAKKTDGASQRTPDADDGGGIFEGAKQAVGSFTGAVKKLVGAE
jgi:hypothetical protein